MLSLFHEYKSCPSVYTHNLFLIAKKAYYKQIRSAKTAFQFTQVETLVQNAKHSGIQALYKSARQPSPSSPIDIPSFLSHCKSLFSSSTSPAFIPIPSCENQSHLITAPFCLDEVIKCMNQAKSKACSLSGYSPLFLRSLQDNLAPLLCQVFNQCLSTSRFPLSWLESIIFFLHKKGCVTDPNNFRSICIQNPFLKLFSSLLSQRLLKFACMEDILPTFQFGFRPNRSTTGAASLLYETVHHRLSQGKKTFACFVDFSKAFDSVDRTLMFVKLQSLGIPSAFCRLFFFILQNSKSVIRSGSALSSPFSSKIGVPQGDPCSPLLFNLFLADLPDSLPHRPPSLHNTNIPYIQYADDLVLLADSSDELQIAIDALSLYCSENSLKINTDKTKCLVFHKGRLPSLSFSLHDRVIEIVSEFKYLGFIFTPQLSFTKHISQVSKKANSRIGFLFHKLPLKFLPLPLVIKVFGCYIFPLFLYGLPLWLNNCANASITSVNSVFTKYLKRYLGVPYFSSNLLVHFVCETSPLSNFLHSCYTSSLNGISFPPVLSGHMLSFADHLSRLPPTFFPIPDIPSEFWHSRSFSNLPLNPTFRKALCFDILNLHHYHYCANSSFHTLPKDPCTCRFCSGPLNYYHFYSCPTLPCSQAYPPKSFPIHFV